MFAAGAKQVALQNSGAFDANLSFIQMDTPEMKKTNGTKIIDTEIDTTPNKELLP